MSTFIENLNPSTALHLSEAPSFAPDARIRNSHFGRYTEVGASSLISHSVFGDYMRNRAYLTKCSCQM